MTPFCYRMAYRDQMMVKVMNSQTMNAHDGSVGYAGAQAVAANRDSFGHRARRALAGAGFMACLSTGFFVCTHGNFDLSLLFSLMAFPLARLVSEIAVPSP